eukprot:CAMPEP_0115119672 /NCGR_PEP_ID=MMETSP0227-20121206/45230_1 /TAXON_ID=89957 /ORGANISM="Polarella glacialis, Strain CCMP 1383" /LENGTH=922 /DNA_ID=CAMNT_0002521185 /DNA_START=146 /DNA_END=2914 /DNA_ORIENTATION=+
MLPQKRTSPGSSDKEVATPIRGKLPWATEPLSADALALEPASSRKPKKPRTGKADPPSKEELAAQAAKLSVELMAASEVREAEPSEEIDAEACVETDQDEACSWELRVERALGTWAEAAPSELFVPGTDQAQRLPFRVLGQALDGTVGQASGPGLSRALSDVFKWILTCSSDPTGDLQAVLTVLLNRSVKQYVLQPCLQAAIVHAFGLKDMAKGACLHTDLPGLALAARQKQQALFSVKAVTVAEVAAIIRDHDVLRSSSAKVSDGLQKDVTALLGRSTGEGRETEQLVRAFQAEFAPSASLTLRALAHSMVMVGPGSSSLSAQARAEGMVKLEDHVVRAFAESGADTAKLSAVVANFTTPEALAASCAASSRVKVLPMRAQVSTSLAEALESFGQDTALLAEWMMDGERAQVHVQQVGGSRLVEVFVWPEGTSCPAEKLEAVCSSLQGSVPEGIDCVLEVVLMRPPRLPPKKSLPTSEEKNENVPEQIASDAPEQAAPEQAAPEQAAPEQATVVVFDLLVLDGRPMTRLPLRERRAKLQALVTDGPRFRLVRGQELEAGVSTEKVKAELDAALGAYYLAETAEKASSKAIGIVLKRLDGAEAEYFAGRHAGASWQAVQKPTATGKEADELLFACLSEEERKHLVDDLSEFHFCVISGRRTGTPEGVRDVLNVESQLRAGGVVPKWYVDEASIDGYRGLKLDATVGGKLLPSRNLALEDASRLGKVCVQCSDDISRWDYYKGEGRVGATTISLAEANAAAKTAERYHISPVAAARFILAKMRGAEEGKPQLGGVYPLGNLGQCFMGREFSRRNFILGDFFVVDKSGCRFDESMSLKEDYDFTCSHLQEHGSIVRINRMLIQAKHETNAGGACSVRDSAGTREEENITILQAKWPGAIWRHHTRKHQVVLRWECLKKSAPEES